jgi:hypothetical protein
MEGSTVCLRNQISVWISMTYYFPGVAFPPTARPKIVDNNQQLSVYIQVPYLALNVLYGFLQCSR